MTEEELKKIPFKMVSHLSAATPSRNIISILIDAIVVKLKQI